MFHDVAGHETLTRTIIGCGVRVHETFGPGLLESVYRACLEIELVQAGLRTDRSRRVPLIYRDHLLDSVYCPDLIVENTVIVELKVVDTLCAVHTAQVLTYLKLTALPIGLLMNFNVTLLKNGVRRVVRPDLHRKSI